MSKVKLAVIDTGIDIYDEELKDFYKFDSDIQIDNGKSIDDQNGHGTNVSKVILRLCKEVIIYPINIFNRGGKTSSLNLLNSLERLIKTDIKVINISAASIDSPHKKELMEVCNRLKDSGKIILCSKHKKDTLNESIPAIFDSVIGVEGHEGIFNDDEYIYKSNQNIQMKVNTKECFVKFKDGVTHFGKNSKGCALATGMVSNIVSKNQNITFAELEKILINNSLADNGIKKSLDKRIEYFTLRSNIDNNLERTDFNGIDIVNNCFCDIENKILYIINTYFAVRKVDLDFIKKYSIMNNFTNIGRHNAYNFFKSINKEFDINIDYKKILLDDLQELKILGVIISLHLHKK